MMIKKINVNTKGKSSQATKTQEKKGESYSGLQLKSESAMRYSWEKKGWQTWYYEAVRHKEQMFCSVQQY